MRIELSKEYVITSDTNQYTLNQQYENGRLLSLGFFPSLEQLLRYYIEYRCRTEKDIRTIQGLLDYQNSLLTALNRGLQPLKFEVIKKG